MWNNLGYTPLVLTPLIAFPVWYWLQKRPKSALPYPPGPKAYPFIGNALDFPLGVPLWEGLTDLAKKYGRELPPRGLSGL